MMPYWNQYATYYGQPPMMTPYDLGGKEGQTVYYEQPATPPFRYGEEIENDRGESEGEARRRRRRRRAPTARRFADVVARIQRPRLGLRAIPDDA